MPDLMRAESTCSLSWPDGPIAVSVGTVTRRLFSSVATGRLPDGDRVFLKQFVSARGRALAKTFDGERAGSRLARQLMPSSGVATPLGEEPDLLVLGYAWRDLVPVDQMLRTDPAALLQLWPSLLAYLHQCLDEAVAVDPGHPSLQGLKCRRCDREVAALNFKGFEVRNIAVDEATGEWCFFDTGPAYLGPGEEAVARVLVSVWLLNWGHPLRRFLSGPPTELVDLSGSLAARTTAAALKREVAVQQKGRMGDVQATHLWGRVAKQLVFATIGRRYLRTLRRWADEHER